MKWKNLVNFVRPELGGFQKYVACVGRVYIAFLAFSFQSLRVFSLCLDEVPQRRWTKFPQRVEKFPRITYIRKRMCVFHIHEINTDGCVVY